MEKTSRSAPWTIYTRQLPAFEFGWANRMIPVASSARIWPSRLGLTIVTMVGLSGTQNRCLKRSGSTLLVHGRNLARFWPNSFAGHGSLELNRPKRLHYHILAE